MPGDRDEPGASEAIAPGTSLADLTISGGGSTAVATAELFSQASRVRRLIDELSACSARLSVADGAMSSAKLRLADAPISALAAERGMDDAAGAILRATAAAHILSTSLTISAEAYGLVEKRQVLAARMLSANFAYSVGAVFPALAMLMLPSTLAVGAGLAVGFALSPTARRETAGWFRANNGALSDPAVVGMVRMAVMSSDDFLGGLFRVHPAIVALLGDEGLRAVGLATTAGSVVGITAHLGALAETPVAVRRPLTRRGETVPESFAERADRIPRGDAQIRIDRYEQPGVPDRFEVYLGGTKDPSLFATREPWDTTSNLHGVALGDAGSYRAVEEAMRQAGVTPESPVQFTGYSQGGLIAAMLASSGEYNAKGLLTLGAPAGVVEVPATVPWLAVEHRDDIVPAAGGIITSDHAVVVRREAFPGELPNDVYFPAHDLDRYRETAAMLDRSDDDRSGPVLGRLNSLASDARATESMMFIAERTERQPEATGRQPGGTGR